MKTIKIILMLLAALLIIGQLSSCIDDGILDNLEIPAEQYRWGDGGWKPGVPAPELLIDSVVNIDSTTAMIRYHINFGIKLPVSASFRWRHQADSIDQEITRHFPDSVVRLLPYTLTDSLQLSDLSSGSVYAVCASAKFASGVDTVEIQAPCIAFSTF